MQGDWQTLEDPTWLRPTIPLALFVRPSPLKGGLIPRQTFEGPALSRSGIPLVFCVRPSPFEKGDWARLQGARSVRPIAGGSLRSRRFRRAEHPVASDTLPGAETAVRGNP